MSKSILVIDTPENCWGCDLEYGHYCGKEKRYIDEEEFEAIPDWCPLRDLPKYKDLKEETDKDIAIGWNRCLSEILKGANGNG